MGGFAGRGWLRSRAIGAGVLLAALTATAAEGCGGHQISSSTSEGTGGASGSKGTGGKSGSGAAGSGGFAGVPPATDQLDLLLMVDNSIGMAEKQSRLANSLAHLFARISATRFRSVHVGVITSSLGGHGADLCSPASPTAFNATQDDKGHLIGTNRPSAGLTSYQNLGFLTWDPGATMNPPGEASLDAVITEASAHVLAAGEMGCPFEAQLEAVYRFLIDPEPPGNVVVSSSVAVVQGLDDVVLEQRARFLRPSSAVAIVILTDENDCSIVDGGPGWLAATDTLNGSTFHLPRATSACAVDPNNACCRSCGLQESSPPAGCGPLGADPECAKGSYDDIGDPLSLRCYDEKRRFGIDFLYPTQRYVDGLTRPTIVNREGQEVTNPLFADLSGGSAPARHPALVFVAGIVGVPWQDMATPDTLNDSSRLVYQTAPELRANGVWENILSNPNNSNGMPNDGLMWETPVDRTTLAAPPNPPTGARLAPAVSTTLVNPINGHEYITESSDLQYACIFPLTSPIDCSTTVGPCECSVAAQAQNKPVCNGTTQTHAKAYPGLRELAVLKGLGEANAGIDNAIVASICPKISDPQSSAFGYEPALDALMDQIVRTVPAQ